MTNTEERATAVVAAPAVPTVVPAPAATASIPAFYRTPWAFTACGLLLVFLLIVGGLSAYELDARAAQIANLTKQKDDPNEKHADHIGNMLRDLSTLNNNGSIGDRCNVLSAITKGRPAFQDDCRQGKEQGPRSILGLGIDEYPLDVLFLLSSIAFACVGSVAAGFRQGGVTPINLVLGAAAGAAVALAIKGGLRAFISTTAPIGELLTNPYLAGFLALAAGASADRVFARLSRWYGGDTGQSSTSG